MGRNHCAVIHLVDVIASQNQNIFGIMGADQIHVLVDRIGGAGVPGCFIHALLRRPQLDKFTEFTAQMTPAFLRMRDQGVRLVLGNHADAANAGIDAVG